MLDIRLACPEDLGAIRVLLAVCLLPAQDISTHEITFFVAESERGIIGVCGIDPCGDGEALIRSLGVMPGYRKQSIGRRLLQRACSHAYEHDIGRLYLLTENAVDYFTQQGFVRLDRKTAPADLRAKRLFSSLCPASASVMVRRLDTHGTANAAVPGARLAEAAKQHFDQGYHCAESVLLAAADHVGIRSPLIPAIATGFCHGTSHSWGTCGALSGAIMAINLTHGRSNASEPVARNYTAVRRLIEEFGQTCGSTLCSELMGCDLDTRDGQRTYEKNRLRNQCREYVGVAARLAGQLIDEHSAATAASTRKDAAA